MERPVICWFKRDLRVCDHPAHVASDVSPTAAALGLRRAHESDAETARIVTRHTRFAPPTIQTLAG